MSGDSAYSFSLTTFSRTGKLLQIEYALSAAQQGKTSLGIRGTFSKKAFGESERDCAEKESKHAS
jgi:hypothetical protein